jgi:hypothetical protein
MTMSTGDLALKEVLKLSETHKSILYINLDSFGSSTCTRMSHKVNLTNINYSLFTSRARRIC